MFLNMDCPSKCLKVRKFQNENMKSSHCQKYERNFLKNSALSIQFFGRIEEIINGFQDCLTFSKKVKNKM